MARSRGRAHDLIVEGSVSVEGVLVTKASTAVEDHQDIVVLGKGDVYVSRAACKLLGALDAFGTDGLDVDGKRCLDAGASTGGFTQVLLERGASHVLALDVGHGQMAPVVRDDPRVTLREGVNVRDLSPPRGPGVGLVVADLSFISLTLVVRTLAPWLDPGGDALLLVKPQFEVGAGHVKGGIVSSPDRRVAAIEAVARAAEEAGLSIAGIRRSVVSGADGNVEFFLWGVKTWQAKGAAEERPHLDGEAFDLEISREVHGLA